MSLETIPLPNVNGRNDRFAYAKTRQGEQWVFVKKAIAPELESNLRREQLWADFVNYVARKEPEAHIRGPRIIGFNAEGALMMEYIDAPQVAGPSDSKTWKAKIDRYAYTLGILDKYAKDFDVDWPPNDEASLANLDKIWEKWFGYRLESNAALLDKARRMIIEGETTMSCGVQHGDLTPWQMFEQDEEWIIYDGEKAGIHLPRFNDLAYGYGRLFTRLRDEETAAILLKKFLENIDMDRDQFFKQFLPVMTFRATGMLADAYNDIDRANYVEEANQLIELCFKEDLSAFLGNK